MPKEKGKFNLPTNAHMKAIKRVIPYFGTQTCLAEALGISKQKVNDWIKGRDIIKSEYAQKISNMLQGRIEFYELRPDLKKISKKSLSLIKM